jgi:hypothetical protein
MVTGTRTDRHPRNGEATEPQARPDLGAFLRETLFPKLTPELVFTHQAHAWKEKTPAKWKGGCPWHESKSGTSFYLDTATLTWRCPACQIGGGPVQYVWRLMGGTGSPRGEDFVQVLRRLADIAGVPFPERGLSEEEKEDARRREARCAILATVMLHTRNVLWSERGAGARSYLHERGFTDEDLRALDVGLYLSAAEVEQAVRAAGHSVEDARAWAVLRRKWEGYIIFPWDDEHGRPLTLYGTWHSRPPPPDGLDPDDFIKRDGIEGWRKHLDKAVHAHRYQGRQILKAHKPEGGWTDAAQDACVRAAVAWAAKLPADQEEELSRHFVREVALELQADPVQLLARVRVARHKGKVVANGHAEAGAQTAEEHGDAWEGERAGSDESEAGRASDATPGGGGR